MIQRLRKYKIVIFALALLLCFGSRILTLGNEVGQRVVVTGIGIDREGEEYKISAQVFTPQLDQTKTQKKSVVTATGKTVGFAVAQLSLKTGRVATVSHCKLIVLGESMREEDVLKPLGYFVADLEINWGAVVVTTHGTAEKAIQGLNGLEQNAEFNWQEFLNNNREVDVIAVNSIREIMLESQDVTRSFLLAVFDVEQSPSQGSQGGGQQGGASAMEQSGGGTEQALLKTGEKTAVFRDGRFVGEIGADEMRGYSWLDRAVKQSDFEVSTEDGDCVVRLKNKLLAVRVAHTDGVPVATVALNVYFDVTDLPDMMLEQGSPAKLERAIEQLIRQDIQKCVQASLALDTDILRLNERFYRFLPKVYAQYGRTLFRSADVKVEVKATLSV